MQEVEIAWRNYRILTRSHDFTRRLIMKAGLVKKPLFWLYIIILVLSFMNVCVYLSVRSIWSFINKTVGGPIPWAILFFILFCLSFIYALLEFRIYLKNQKGGAGRTRAINIVIPLVLAILFCAVDIFLYMMLGSSQGIIPRNLLSGLPYVILFGAIIFFIIFYPNLKVLHNKKFRYITAFIIIAGILLFISNIGGVEITSGPYVQLVDDSNIAVIWTNILSTLKFLSV
jgi:hypothetical protein